jgi:hypothetical protein
VNTVTKHSMALESARRCYFRGSVRFIIQGHLQRVIILLQLGNLLYGVVAPLDLAPHLRMSGCAADGLQFFLFQVFSQFLADVARPVVAQ